MTVVRAPSTQKSAATSVQRGRSPRNTTPLSTPITGMISMATENTPTGTEVTSLIHAQCAKAKETKTL